MKTPQPMKCCGDMSGPEFAHLGHFRQAKHINAGHNTIRSNGQGSYDVYSESGRRMGKNLSKHQAHVRIGQIEYFKKHKG
jgi:hypothetical protein